MTRYESPSNGRKAPARLEMRYAAHEGKAGRSPTSIPLRGASLKRRAPPRSYRRPPEGPPEQWF
jgi:hypothetical protein